MSAFYRLIPCPVLWTCLRPLSSPCPPRPQLLMLPDPKSVFSTNILGQIIFCYKLTPVTVVLLLWSRHWDSDWTCRWWDADSWSRCTRSHHPSHRRRHSSLCPLLLLPPSTSAVSTIIVSQLLTLNFLMHRYNLSPFLSFPVSLLHHIPFPTHFSLTFHPLPVSCSLATSSDFKMVVPQSSIYFCHDFLHMDVFG